MTAVHMTVFVPRVPDQRTEAQISTLMGATSPGNQAVMAQLAAQKAEQDAKDAAIEDQLGTLSSRAATLQIAADQMAPALAAAEGEHQHLQDQITTTGHRVDDLEATQAAQDTDLAALHTELTTTAQQVQAAQQAATSAQQATTATATATQAKAAADTATTTAGNAQSTASTALSQAGTAKQTADTAAANASTALTTANTAKATADAATATANAAKAKADQVATDLAALASRVAALEARRMYQEFGQATLGLSLVALGGTVTLPVVWTTPMPNTVYDIRTVSLPDALAGKLTIQSVTAKTQNGCTVTLRASVALTLTGSVTLSATCLA